MPKFQKRPVVVEAELFDRDKLHTLSPEFREQIHRRETDDGTEYYVHTLEGSLNVSDGDWIIKGTKGEFYPCKPDIFKQIYDRVG